MYITSPEMDKHGTYLFLVCCIQSKNFPSIMDLTNNINKVLYLNQGQPHLRSPYCMNGSALTAYKAHCIAGTCTA